MRTALLCLTIVAASAANAGAQSSGAAGGEGSVTVHALRREDSSKTWLGGGVGGAWSGNTLGIAAEATLTRREGHNDWHALAGPRVVLPGQSRARVFLQLLAGTVIRQKEARFSAQAGGGVDFGLGGRTSLRLLLAGMRDQTESGPRVGGRLSVGLVVR